MNNNNNNNDTFTESIKLEAAQVLWETVISAQAPSRIEHPASLVRKLVGVAQLRDYMRDTSLLRALHEGWEWLEANDKDYIFDCIYDWEYTPWFRDNCIEWDTTFGTVTLKGDYMRILKEYVEMEEA